LQCTMNFCLRHRHSSDHDCKTSAASRANRSPNHAAKIQGNMTEDEALAHALARSIQELDESHDRTHRRNQQTTVPAVVNGDGASSSKDKCSLS